jgi:glycosyltransferase involved in cell wall biosynthesis
LSVRVKEVRIGDRAILDFSRYPRVHQPTSEPAVPAFNIIGHSTVASGVGHSARLCARSAEAAGLQAHAVDCGEVVEQAALLFRRIEPPGRVNVIHVNADQVPSVAALFGPAYLRDRYNVGVWHWELGEFPDCWLESFAPLQEIWAPSQFILRAVAAKSPIPVVHMPHGVDVPTVGRASRSDFGLPTDRVLFLLIYDMRSFQARKNPEAAIDSFARAFPNGRDAALVLKVANGAANPDDLARLQSRCRDTPGTILIDEMYPIERVHQLQSVCDCYVSLHRAEGFGFNLAESMLLGKPVIATGWSGNMDFMNAANACLVDYALTPIATDVGPYRSGQIWAEPDVEHAAWHMTRLAADASLRESIGRAAAAHLSAHFSCRVAGERMRERLRIIGRMCPPAGASATRGAAR